MSSDHSQLRERADEVFDRISPYAGDGLRNHCLRLHAFAGMLLEREGLPLGDDLGYLIAMVHDLGLVCEVEGRNYLERTRALFHRETDDLDLGAVAPEVIDECLIYNHRLRPVSGISREAECFRRAVWIEHSRGHRRYGLERDTVRGTFAELPRDNLDRVLADFARRVITREPTTLVNGIFF